MSVRIHVAPVFARVRIQEKIAWRIIYVLVSSQGVSMKKSNFRQFRAFYAVVSKIGVVKTPPSESHGFA